MNNNANSTRTLGIISAALAATSGAIDFLKPKNYIPKARKIYINNTGHPGIKNLKVAAQVNVMYDKWATQYPGGTQNLHTKATAETHSSGEGNDRASAASGQVSSGTGERVTQVWIDDPVKTVDPKTFE